MTGSVQDEKSIFLRAVEIDAPDQRAEFLDVACAGNPQLRAAVEGLLHGHQNPPRLVLAANVPAATMEQPVDEQAGAVIGPYKLLQQIGEGGFGIVYMAEQQQPVRRKVALKIIKPGMDTKEVVARFESERQALALMDHPNIARVFDAGATDSARPYFVMELVKGITITQYCDNNHLPAGERLELFIQVCQAVQHAHQKGVIHRDIKPSNVMITMHDGRPVPKVIDFGVAKATSQQLTERTLFTAYGQMIGTPAYMSPEQAELSGLDIDTRSDIYSLGVLLYELLTGTTPFDSRRLREAAFAEMQRIIREEEPPRPSTRISTLAAQALSTLAQQHGTDEHRLRHLLRGELDWIVMKSLEKDRERRYESASAFAQDLRRYLSDDPVQACPPSAAYRLKKFAGRNKGVLVTLSAVAAALLIGIAASLWQASEAIAARKLADQRLLQEERARRETEAERQRAAANYDRAREAVDQMLTRVALEEVGAVPEMKEIREKLLHDAVQFYTELLQLNPGDAQSYFKRGKVSAKLGQKKDALADFEKALELEPNNPDFLIMLGRQAGQDALALAQRAVQVAPDAPWPRIRLAELLISLQRVEEGKAQREEFIKRMPKEAAAYAALSKLSLSLQEPPQNAMDYARKAVALDATSDKCFLALGNALSAAGEIDAAGKAYDEAVRLNRQPNDLDSCIVFEARAGHCMYVGDYATALADYDKAIRIAPGRLHVIKRRARVHFLLGNYAEALADVKTSLDILPDDPSALMPKDLSPLAWISTAEVAACPDEGFRNGVRQLIDQSLEGYREAIRLNPNDNSAHRRLGHLLFFNGLLDEAMVSYREAIHLNKDDGNANARLAIVLAIKGQWEEAVGYFREDVRIENSSAAHANLGIALRHNGQLDEAIASYREAIRLKKDNHLAHSCLGAAFTAKGQLDEAIACYREAIRSNRRMAPGHNGLCWALQMTNQLNEAIASGREAVRIEPTFPSHHNDLGEALLAAGQIDGAIACFRRAVGLDRISTGYSHHEATGSTTIQANPVHAQINLADALHAQGQLDEAVSTYQLALHSYRASPRLDQHADAAAYRKVAWFRATSPELQFRDPAEAVELANKAVQLAPMEYHMWNTLGVSLYRAGDSKAAEDALEHSLQIGNGGCCSGWFFLAMAHWRLDNKEEAQKWYDQAVQWMEKHQPRNEELRRFRDEAAMLLGLEDSDDQLPSLVK